MIGYLFCTCRQHHMHNKNYETDDDGQWNRFLQLKLKLKFLKKYMKTWSACNFLFHDLYLVLFMRFHFIHLKLDLYTFYLLPITLVPNGPNWSHPNSILVLCKSKRDGITTISPIIQFCSVVWTHVVPGSWCI